MIVPGSANPLLMAQAGDPLDELGKIERSVRTRSSAAGHFSRTPAASEVDPRTFTISFCVKRSSLAQFQTVISAGNSNSVAPQETILRFSNDGSNDLLQFIWNGNAGGTGDVWTTSPRLFRDPASHAHIVLGADIGNATRASRLTLEINGEVVTFTPSGNGGNSAATAWLNAAHLIRIACQSYAVAGLFDGYFSHFAVVTGKKLSASAFGQFHPKTGQWRPKSKAAIRAAVAAGGGARNGWGANGFFLPFDDVTSLTTLGYDRSQSDTDTTGNNWTATNISLTPGQTYDSMLDTPTNVYATMNPIMAASGIPRMTTFSDGNLSISDASLSDNYACATIPVPAGKWYVEANIVSITSGAISIGTGGQFTKDQNYYLSNSGLIYKNGVSTGVSGATYAAGDVVGMEIDGGTKSVTFYKNGVFQGSVSGCNETYTIWVWMANTASVVMNFGQGPLASGASYHVAAKGYFKYAPSTGFKALCTKNLPVKPSGPMKSADAFVAVTNSGANIVSGLSAASPWSDWIRIYKRRDAAEGWRWQFSDDAANFLDSSSTAAKAAFPDLSGTSYVGYAIKVSAANGVATGRLTHVNGVADVVVDGLANSRKAVILVNEAGSNWYFYHPDLTAGKLLYLNLTNVETTDATISGVTASGFTVAAALASGTYRWIAIAEVEGFSRLFKHTGNASVDGVFDATSFSVAAWMVKRTAATDNCEIYDTARSASNVASAVLNLNGAAAETTLVRNDMLSNGVKLRTVSSESNAASTYIGLAFAAFPFRYANAR